MAKALRVPIENAESVRRELLARKLIDHGRQTQRDGAFLYIPVIDKMEGGDVMDVELPAVETTTTKLRDALAGTIPEHAIAQLKTAYDLVGDIAILEIDENLRAYERHIGETLLKLQPAVNVVVRKAGRHEGELRLQEHVHLAGEQRFTTIVTEHGISLVLDLRKTYYSVRSATERARIASLVQPGERVLVMFSGIAPFVLVIAKHSLAEEVIGVELNADAHQFAEHNLKRNKVVNARVWHGDVRDIVPRLGLFDRVVMPLPHTAADYLDVAVPATKPHGIIHLYHFSSEEDVRRTAQDIPARLAGLGRTGHVQHIQKCGNLAPGVHRWSIDISVNNSAR